MAKRNRTSPVKRQREAEKRERQARRAAKAAMKRERKFERANADAEGTSNEDGHDEQAVPGGPAVNGESHPPSSEPGLNPAPAPPAGEDSTPA